MNTKIPNGQQFAVMEWWRAHNQAKAECPELRAYVRAWNNRAYAISTFNELAAAVPKEFRNFMFEAFPPVLRKSGKEN